MGLQQRRVSADSIRVQHSSRQQPLFIRINLYYWHSIIERFWGDRAKFGTRDMGDVASLLQWEHESKFQSVTEAVVCRCRPDVSLLTCLWEYLCILYRWLLVAVYLERLQAAREQENLSSIEETLLNIAYVEQELWILREDKTFKWVSNWKLGILRKVEWQWLSPAPPCPCLLFAGSSLTKSLRC